MRFTVGVPVHNEEGTLEACLRSVLLAHYVADGVGEVLVCLNGCTDQSRVVAEKYKVRVLESEKGKSKAMKRIVDEARGEVVIFTDADCVVERNAYRNVLRDFCRESVVAVTGKPVPYEKKSVVYDVLNARMLDQRAEIAQFPLEGLFEKPFIHGRIFGMRTKALKEAVGLEDSLSDDAYLSHFVLQKYGRRALVKEEDAVVHYQAVQSVSSWWKKWVRIWSQLDDLYVKHPEFAYLKASMRTKIDWDYLRERGLYEQVCFIGERTLHHAGRLAYTLLKNVKDFGWERLDDTKKVRL